MCVHRTRSVHREHLKAQVSKENGNTHSPGAQPPANVIVLHWSVLHDDVCFGGGVDELGE